MIPGMRRSQPRRSMVRAMMARRKMWRVRRSAWIRCAMRRRSISHGSRRRSWCHTRRYILAVGTTTIPSTMGRVLEAFAILLETKGLATLAPVLVDPRCISHILRRRWACVMCRRSRRSRWNGRYWWRRTMSGGWCPARGGGRVGKARWRHGGIPDRELFVKRRWISFQNGFASRFNGFSMCRVVVAVLALAARAASGGGGKALTVELETAVLGQMRVCKERRRELHCDSIMVRL